MTDKIYLGKIDRVSIYLYKHEWQCDWYWGFGYLGNHHHHYHFKNYLSGTKDCSEIFQEPAITNKQWWILRDLFKQAYDLTDAAKVYQYGGHQTYEPGITDMIKDKSKADALNADLAKVLDLIWELVSVEWAGKEAA